MKDTVDSKTYYLLDCSSIAGGEYYLTVHLDVNEQYEYNLSDCIYEENNLAKKQYKEISLDDGIATTYDLAQNFPNPFNPSTTIRYQIPQNGLVTLKIYDILGAEVAALVNEEKVAGKNEVNFNASSFASGVYIYKIQAGEFVSSKKMILLK